MLISYVLVFKVIFFISLIANIILIIVLFRKSSKNTNISPDIKTYIVLNDELRLIIHDYVNIILKPKVQTLQKNYNLNKNSPLEATKSYMKHYDELIYSSAKDIITSLSKKTREVFLYYFTEDVLTRKIINHIINFVNS